MTLTTNTTSAAPATAPVQSDTTEQTSQSKQSGAFEVLAAPTQHAGIKDQVPVKVANSQIVEDGFVVVESSREFFASDAHKSASSPANAPREASIKNSIFNNPFTRLVAALPSLAAGAADMARNSPQMVITLVNTLERHQVPYTDLLHPAKFLTPATIKGLVGTANELAGPDKQEFLTAAFDKLSKLSATDLAGVLNLANTKDTSAFQKLIITSACLFLIAAQGVVESRYATNDPDSQSWFDKAILELSKLTLKELSTAWTIATTVKDPLFSCLVLGGLFFWKVASSTVPDKNVLMAQIAQTVQTAYKNAQILFQVAQMASGLGANNKNPQPIIEDLD